MGKTGAKYLEPGIKDFHKRLKRFHPVEIRTLSGPKSTDPETLRSEEAKIYAKNLDANDYLVLLDEKGTGFSSRQFAYFIEEKSISVPKKLVFIIGGPHGFKESLYQRSNQLLSLSKMTFTHDMVRLFFMEQLYRAYSIINNTPYHHD